MGLNVSFGSSFLCSFYTFFALPEYRSHDDEKFLKEFRISK